MLETLKRVHWRRARHAYGSAADVPKMLRGLASEDEGVRYDAWNRFHASVFHQGNRYDSTALAVPFLFELVLDPATHDREDLVFLLVSLAFGYEAGFLPLLAVPAEGSRRWEPEEWAAYDAVAERVASLAPLLREAEPLRLAAAYALGNFPKSSAGMIGDVRRAYDASTDQTARATLLIALAMVSLHAPDHAPEKQEVVSLFRRVHGSDGSTILRSSAAAGLVLLGATDDDVVRTISAAIVDGSVASTTTPWNDGDFGGYLATVLPLAAGGREEALAATLIKGLAHAPRNAKMSTTYVLLDVVGPAADYRALSDLQLRALRAIDEHGQWDRNGDAIVNFALMSERFGLPDDRDDFRSFVQAAEASARGEAVDWRPRRRPRPSRPQRPDPYAAVWEVLFGTMLLLWLVFAVTDPDFASRAPGGWVPWLVGVLGLCASVFLRRRRT